MNLQGHALQLPVHFLHVRYDDFVWFATLRFYMVDFSVLSNYLGDKFFTLHGDQPQLPRLARLLNSIHNKANTHSVHC